MCNIKKFTVRLVKEDGSRYDFNRKITSPKKAQQVFNEVLEMNSRLQETFAICTTDIKNNITGIFEITTGSLSSSIVHPRDVYQRAILHNAAAIILCHNHPSGDPQPSNNDKKITGQLIKAGKIIGIEVLDHIIIGDNCYLSMKEEGVAFD
jgi:DNA repair protein RadC